MYLMENIKRIRYKEESFSVVIGVEVTRKKILERDRVGLSIWLCYSYLVFRSSSKTKLNLYLGLPSKIRPSERRFNCRNGRSFVDMFDLWVLRLSSTGNT
jgi:hypothetical protein